MIGRTGFQRLARGVLLVIAAAMPATSLRTEAATKNLDLDGNAANGAESQCDLNVLQTFPVRIENRVTNRSVGNAYTFSWKSAGPGGFTSSITPGSTGGVGAKWVWTTNQTVYSFTGDDCGQDICFLQAGASAVCSEVCLADGAVLAISKSGVPGEVILDWAGGQGSFTVYRASTAATIFNTANAISTTDLFRYTDNPPPGGVFFYNVRGVDCATRKACTSDADCNQPGDGICVTRGPFGAPGRSLLSTDVTVSAASLTSSLITFFSPPTEVFRITSSVAPGGAGVAFQQTLTNVSDEPITTTVAAYPPGCCNAPHQINCDGECFNYLTDPFNCGGCGVACGERSYCSGGECSEACAENETLCGEECFDLQNDKLNCGECGNVCPDLTETENCEGSKCHHDPICVEGGCDICPTPFNTACGNTCVDIHEDASNCGGCGHDCNLLCPEGTVSNYCNGGGTCCCVQPEGPEICVPSSFAANVGFVSAQPPRLPTVEEAPVCETQETQAVIPAGESFTDCLVAGMLAKEVPTSVVVCGDGIPAGSARCANGDPASQGTFMKLVPDPNRPIGNAFITPYAAHVSEPSSDGLIEPGETVAVNFEVMNAGPVNIADAFATLLSPPVDLTDDGIENPVGVTISGSGVWFGLLQGTAPSSDCLTPSMIHPVRGSAFVITFPLGHPSDTSRPFTLHFTGLVNGVAWSQDVPVSLGVADKCDYAAGNNQDYDGIEGLIPPHASMVPVGESTIFPASAFPAGQTRNLGLKQYCGSVVLGPNDTEPPQIVGISEQTRGPLDIATLGINAFNPTDPNDPLFHHVTAGNKWEFNLRTTELGTGVFTITIRLASRKEYTSGFQLVGD